MVSTTFWLHLKFLSDSSYIIGPPPRLYGIEKESNTLVYVDDAEGGEDLNLQMSLLFELVLTTLGSQFPIWN